MHWIKKNYRFLLITVFLIALIYLTFFNHTKSVQQEKAKATTESIEKETDEFEPYENGGKLDNKLSDSNGKKLRLHHRNKERRTI